MTTLQFTPSDSGVFQFQPTLDNSVFTVTVPWNVYGGRYYVNIFTLQGALVYSMPLISSPANYPIKLLPPLNPVTGLPWVSTLYYVGDESQFVVLP